MYNNLRLLVSNQAVFHTNRRPKKPPIPPTSTTQSAPTDPPTPDICKLTRFDAVSFLRRELYVFRLVFRNFKGNVFHF